MVRCLVCRLRLILLMFIRFLVKRFVDVRSVMERVICIVVMLVWKWLVLCDCELCLLFFLSELVRL